MKGGRIRADAQIPVLGGVTGAVLKRGAAEPAELAFPQAFPVRLRDGKARMEWLLPAVGAAVPRTTAAALGLRLGEVDVQGPAVEVGAVQRVDGRIGLM